MSSAAVLEASWPYEDRVIETFARLKKLASNFSGWSTTASGADLWVDGFDAITSTDHRVFESYWNLYRRVLPDHESSETIPTRLECLVCGDIFLRHCRNAGADRFWPALAVQIAAFIATGGPPRLEAGHLSIVNDTILMILSRRYRHSRFLGFNRGVALSWMDEELDLDAFRPEQRALRVAGRILLKEDPIRVQAYNINHDLAHIAFHSDLYLTPGRSRDEAARRFIRIEELCVSNDPLVLSDLLEWDIDLRMIDECSAGTSNQPEAIQRLARDESEYLAARHALVDAAVQTLDRFLTSGDLEGVRPAHPESWVAPAELESHAIGAVTMADRLTSAQFKPFLALLRRPPLLPDSPAGRDFHNLPPREAGAPCVSAAVRQRVVEWNCARAVILGCAEAAYAVRDAEVSPVTLRELDAIARQAATLCENGLLAHQSRNNATLPLLIDQLTEASASLPDAGGHRTLYATSLWECLTQAARNSYELLVAEA